MGVNIAYSFPRRWSKRRCGATLNGREAVESLYKKSHGQARREKTPAEKGETFDVPMLGIRVDEIRAEQAKKTFQALLFGGGAEIEVAPDHCFSISLRQYSPNWHYDGRFRFGKHFFPIVGELKGEGEQFECAQTIDQMPEVESWIRNLAQRPKTAFWLQTLKGRFFPDFVAKLRYDRILVVEYKGGHLDTADDAKEKDAVGRLWMDRSDGRCLFVMPTKKNGARFGPSPGADFPRRPTFREKPAHASALAAGEAQKTSFVKIPFLVKGLARMPVIKNQISASR